MQTCERKTPSRLYFFGIHLHILFHSHSTGWISEETLNVTGKAMTPVSLVSTLLKHIHNMSSICIAEKLHKATPSSKGHCYDPRNMQTRYLTCSAGTKKNGHNGHIPRDVSEISPKCIVCYTLLSSRMWLASVCCIMSLCVFSCIICFLVFLSGVT